jgi:hypothetical protein
MFGDIYDHFNWNGFLKEIGHYLDRRKTLLLTGLGACN